MGNVFQLMNCCNDLVRHYSEGQFKCSHSTSTQHISKVQCKVLVGAYFLNSLKCCYFLGPLKCIMISSSNHYCVVIFFAIMFKWWIVKIFPHYLRCTCLVSETAYSPRCTLKILHLTFLQFSKSIHLSFFARNWLEVKNVVLSVEHQNIWISQHFNVVLNPYWTSHKSTCIKSYIFWFIFSFHSIIFHKENLILLLA